MFDELRNDEISLRFHELLKQEREAIEEIDDPCLRRLEDLLNEEEMFNDDTETERKDISSRAPRPSLSFETLWEMSKRMNVEAASQFFNMSGKTFKLRCRQLGIPKWRYRTFQSYYSLLQSDASSEKDKVRLPLRFTF